LHRIRVVRQPHEYSRPESVLLRCPGNPDKVARLAHARRGSEHRNLIFALRAFHPVIAIV
jgi:hypothetical protein